MKKMQTFRDKKHPKYIGRYLVTTWYLLGFVPIYQSWVLTNSNI